MATLVPPPTKRQRTEVVENARQQQEIESVPSDLGSIRVQFFDQATGSTTGPAVSVPVADATVNNLETLLNTLQGNVGTREGNWGMRIRDRKANVTVFSYCRAMMNEYRTGLPTNPMIKMRRPWIFLQTYITLYSSPD